MNRNGQHWIRDALRMALYLRDGMACVYCKATIEDDRITLDHLKPVAKGGTNDHHNLVTCCLHCNVAKSDRPWRPFAGKRAAFIENTIWRVIDVEAAKAIIRRRGGFSQAVRNPR